jgi:hypothetical protein
MMSKLALAAAIAAALTGTAYGQQPQSTTTGPTSSAASAPLTHFYIPNLAPRAQSRSTASWRAA